MEASFELLQKILKPGGKVVICDFFKTEHHGDGGRAMAASVADMPWQTFIAR